MLVALTSLAWLTASFGNVSFDFGGAPDFAASVLGAGILALAWLAAVGAGCAAAPGPAAVRESRPTTFEASPANVAHDLSQPITSIMTNASAALRWLDRDPPDLGEVKAALQRIEGEGERAGSFVAKLHGSSRQDMSGDAGLDTTRRGSAPS